MTVSPFFLFKNKTQHSRIVAMTVVYAALNRQQLVEDGFRFDSVVMEEAGQVKVQQRRETSILPQVLL